MADLARVHLLAHLLDDIGTMLGGFLPLVIFMGKIGMTPGLVTILS